MTDPTALVQHYLEVDRPDEALSLVERLLASDPGDSELHELRAVALYDAERYVDAAVAAHAGLELKPTSVLLLDVLALSYQRRGKFPEAERRFLDALQLAPEDPVLLSHYALLLAEGGATDKAERVWSRAAAIDPNDEVVRRSEITLAFVLGRDTQAADASRDLLSDMPNDPLAHSVLGSLASERGSSGAARRHFDEAARYDFDDDIVEVALEARALDHPLMLPLWPLYRLGVVKTWMLGIGVFALLTAIELYLLASVWIAAYIAMVAYSWIAPPLIRRWVFRGRP